MIHLVNMPFGSITHPNLALGLMRAQLGEAGLATHVHNLNLFFAQRVGFGSYERIALFKGVETQVSEWLFAAEAWREPFGPSEDEFLALSGEELGELPHIDDPRAWLRMVRNEVVPGFLDECLLRLAAAGPVEVVGFSCTFFQTIASLALGRRIKERWPEARLVYGGACFHDEMGDELIRKVPWIDAVSTGEADDVIVPLFQALSEQRPPRGLQGVLYRDSEGAVGPLEVPHHPATSEVLDALPDPDYDEFFAQAAEVGLAAAPSWQQLVYLPFESSRGCWWGQKHHCTFCGLNADGMGYRAKTADKVLRTLESFARRYPSVQTIRATDNILAQSYFRELLPVLAEKPFGDLRFFYEVKVNMTRAQVKALADAGICYIQPGIESLSANLIQQMRKGMSALQNVFFMRCCREYGVMPVWNNLIRVPGERAEDYAQMAAWLPKLVHLWPPSGGSPKIELHRFSPYFAEGERWLSKRRPASWYAGLFPGERFDLDRVAYYFDGDWKNTLDGDAPYQALVDGMFDWIDIWRLADELPVLLMHEREDGGLLIEDTRGGSRVTHEVDALAAQVYRAIDAPAKPKQILRKLDAAGVSEALGPKRTLALLEGFVASELALSDEGAYVALATGAATPEVSFSFRRQQFSKRPTNQTKSENQERAA
ncbi:RiPP maturation radical SAM C-methyltransferase [Haliangium ochraceum]|uniref:Radical SAM domain protein n=1 Tax=Haliangium ochraceum (strain DSM 14365 / JCM 11303 / SMP-2) TaxID=502025 RepID=D0LWS9_HALO1|nr:RiPP maturation radical SAM C-methyltransferase [Haliangium ochraceum]ACY14176.1 Radical SAM domain protein [Haliangium ochraceum DSM 14365]